MKRISILTLIFILIFTTFSFAGMEGSFFSDVDEHCNEEAIDALITLKIANGFPDNSYKPEQTLTRAQGAVLLTKTLYGDNVKINKNIQWKDLNEKHWAKKYVDTAYEYGIVSGCGNNLFKPEDKITYIQMITMTLNTLGYKANLLGNYPTAQTDKGKELKLLKDVEYKNLNDPCTRGGAAQIIYNAFNQNMVMHNGKDFQKLNYTFLEGMGFRISNNPEEKNGKYFKTYENETNKRLISHYVYSKEESKNFNEKLYNIKGFSSTGHEVDLTKGVTKNEYILCICDSKGKVILKEVFC